MNPDVETRVRQANLVPRGEQLEHLFGEGFASALLRDVYSKKEGRMTDTTGRKPEMAETESSTGTAIPEGHVSTNSRNRPIMAWVLTAVGIISTVGIVWALVAGDEPEPAATPVEIGTTFMNALNAHDVDAMLALTESEEVLARTADDGTIEWFRSQIEQRGVLGWTYDFTCSADESTVTCPYEFSNHITDSFGLEPYGGSEVLLRIEDGVVALFQITEDTDDWQTEGLDLLYEWLVENFPDEQRIESLGYNYTDEANLEFLKEYIPLLLADDPGVAGGAPEPAATPVEIGTTFMNALNAHDVDAMLALTESEEVLASEEGTIEWFRSEIEQEGVLGWTYDYACHEASPESVICEYAFSNHISDAFDLGPYPGSEVILRITDGRIASFTNDELTKEWHEGGALDLFYQWMVTNHPDEARVENFQYHYSDEANLDFIKEYIPLLLADDPAAG